jgi:carbon monoxide dehydrogenase subunit G
MKFEGEVEIAAPREVVWQTLMDPKAMARAVPGVRSLEEVGPGEFRAQMQIGVGALRGTFTGTLKLSDLVPTSECRLTMQGRGSIGEFSGTGGVRLREHGANTMIAYDADVRLGGPMAGMGEGLMRTITQTLIAQGAKVFTEICHAQVQGAQT